MRKREEIEKEFSPTSSLDGARSFFLVGIGGAGMSALARMLKTRGYRVRGTDSTASAETERLISEGIEVRIGHSGEFISSDDALVLTDAIDLSLSPEVARARELGIPMVRRSQALGWLLKDYKVIAVTGTHGKTTTTGMTGAGLIAAGLDPLVVVGASIPEWGGPVREGKGEWAVVEACEAYDSFHDIDPTIAVLTNLEPDHLDYHGTWESLKDSVLRFVNRAEEELVVCASDPGARELAEHWSWGEPAYYRPETFSEFSGGMPRALPGAHNQENAAAALLATSAALVVEGRGSIVNADPENKVAAAIAAFTGAERRLQILHDGEITVIDDYAHHPTEVKASLSALKERYGNRRLLVAFQPHLYSRTAENIPQFAEALSVADVVVVTDIYPAREDPIPGISSARIAEQIQKPTYYVPSRHLLPREVLKLVRPGDVVVGMGAGNIGEFGPSFIKELTRSKEKLRIAVCYGGDSAEREVSIHSGREIHAALSRLGHDSFLVDISELLFKKGDVRQFTGPDRPDLAFLAVHGTNAEDGAIQGFFELLHIPYTGSNIQASALAMDKAMTKRVLGAAGVKMPKGVLLTSPDQEVPIQPPLIVKPNAQGSTVGLSFVESQDELSPALQRAFAYDTQVLVEEWVRGMEISTPVLDDEALLPVEIAPTSGRYDFESKYTPGATEEIVPARLPQETLEQARQIAVHAHRALGCTGATRTDAIVSDGEIYVLEVNTLPGMTGTSLLPNSAAAMGISFDQLCQRLVDDAMRRHEAKA